jgi:hypothetical protein
MHLQRPHDNLLNLFFRTPQLEESAVDLWLNFNCLGLTISISLLMHNIINFNNNINNRLTKSNGLSHFRHEAVFLCLSRMYNIEIYYHSVNFQLLIKKSLTKCSGANRFKFINHERKRYDFKIIKRSV